MNYKSLANRINRISDRFRREEPRVSVISQNLGESDEEVQQRADQLKEQNIRQFGRPGLIVIISNFSGMEVKDVTNP
jgi:hypothetical protein